VAGGCSAPGPGPAAGHSHQQLRTCRSQSLAPRATCQADPGKAGWLAGWQASRLAGWQAGRLAGGGGGPVRAGAGACRGTGVAPFTPRRLLAGCQLLHPPAPAPACTCPQDRLHVAPVGGQQPHAHPGVDLWHRAADARDAAAEPAQASGWAGGGQLLASALRQGSRGSARQGGPAHERTRCRSQSCRQPCGLASCRPRVPARRSSSYTPSYRPPPLQDP
jgi:hypothetical protein